MEEGLGIGLGTLAFLGIVWTVLWAFVPLAVARIWTHTADTSKRQKQALAEAQRQTEALRDCHKVLYSIWAVGYQGETADNTTSRAPSRHWASAPANPAGE